LDGIRALSISLVFVGHLVYSHGSPERPSWWTDDYAHYGVRIFLAISGFLITTLLVKERDKTGKINLKKFYIRRAYRVLPVAYSYMAVVTILFHRSIPWQYFLIAYTYFTSYAVHSPWVLIHLWSLSVEEQFYLLWPILMLLGVLTARRFAFSAMVVAPVFRFVLVLPVFVRLLHESDTRGTLWFFPSVVDSLAVGCLLALYQKELGEHRPFFVWHGFPLIWVATLAIPIIHHYHYLVRYWHLGGVIQVASVVVFNIGIALCIQNAIWTSPRILNTWFIIWIGQLSYSLYLWQMLFANPNVTSWVTTFPQNILLTMLTAAASFYAIEQPVLRLRERIVGSPIHQSLRKQTS
jgi:peptidoglycan/LPS O-acetylase OafA/YrhL